MTITTCLNTPFSVNKIFGHFTTLVRNNDIPLRIAPHYMDKPQVKIVAIFEFDNKLAGYLSYKSNVY